MPAPAGATELRAYDATGRLVLRQAVAPAAAELTVEVRGWAGGLYQFVLSGASGVLGTQRVSLVSTL